MNRMVPVGTIALVLGGCGGHHVEDPASQPIPAVDRDAVYVVNGDDASISVIDAASSAVIGTIQLENVEYPHHIYLSPDAGTLLVAVPGADLSGGHSGGGGHGGHGGAVLALEAATGRLIRARRLDAPNHNAAFGPDGAIWTAQVGAPGRVLVLDPSSLATRTAIGVQNDPAEITFSSTHAFVANTASDSVTAIAVATGESVATIPVGDAPVGAWPGGDGRMYVDNEAGKSLSVIDTATLAVTATFPLGFTPAVAAIAPGGDLWVTDTDTGKLVFLRASDGMKLGELATGAGAHAIAFHRSGAKAFVTNQAAGTVAVIDVASKTLVGTVAVGTKPNGIVFRAAP